jgi:hypothetical protein
MRRFCKWFAIALFFPFANCAKKSLGAFGGGGKNSALWSRPRKKYEIFSPRVVVVADILLCLVHSVEVV